MNPESKISKAAGNNSAAGANGRYRTGNSAPSAADRASQEAEDTLDLELGGEEDPAEAEEPART